MIVVVTGAAGYIGGQTVLLLRDAGHTVYGIDRVRLPQHLRHVPNGFLRKDFAADTALAWIRAKQPEAIIHCAGTSLVGPSITDPADYYNNNVVGTLRLCDYMREHLPHARLIYSSSAATYGNPPARPCEENDAMLPVSPYGESKAMVDMILRSYHRAYGLNFVSFRYFNACGADPQTRHGQAPGATHIIARVLESIRDGREFVLNGQDYLTDDGTCVRDYVHVEDIARAHALAMDATVPVGVYNLGLGTGTSNLQIIKAAERITGRPVSVVAGERRPGDPAELTANGQKFSTLVGWQKWSLDDMIGHAWKWYVRNNRKI